MGWLQRIFGGQKSEAPPADAPTGDAIPPERVGLNGEYDQSGLAKRVAKAFDDNGLEDEERLWVAQTGGTVVLKGEVADQATLDQAKSIASGVSGATSVDSSQVKVS
ncbi:MAG: BON domain-containing protein [Leptolyngbyaceae cyanobacterium RU_5_1]|nr:BON domain-containing protein [Leptolyngbyaceae cyanobacterium RU_5_1]